MIYPVILSGGSGTRLWPLSREHYPKQLLCLNGEYSLLQDTVKRLDGLKDISDPIVVCNEEYRFLVAEQLRQLGQSNVSIILEPEGRNTAPALTLAALRIYEDNPNAIMLVMPADHVIQDQSAFQQAVQTGAELAQEHYLVTFGITPITAETGYGYIKRGKPINVPSGCNDSHLTTHTSRLTVNDSRLTTHDSRLTPHDSRLTSYHIETFVEKPDTDTAERYLQSGNYFWNSGIFVMRADDWLKEIAGREPGIHKACKQAYEIGHQDGDFYRVDKPAFLECPSNSIDYAVMEKTDRATVVPLEAGWSDIGAWPAMWELGEQDEQGNVLKGDIHTYDTKNSLLIAQNRYLATVGVDNIIVVETSDAILVANKDQAQNVKEIVKKLKNEERSEYQTHRCIYRPWGFYESVDSGHQFQVKRLTVNPGASLSLQLHHKRAEHWVVVKGTAKVTRGDDVFTLKENESTFIPVETKHRLENPSETPLEIIEVQSGSYLGEDDIERFEDIYNRHDA